jgi:hypothetical protein
MHLYFLVGHIMQPIFNKKIETDCRISEYKVGII